MLLQLRRLGIYQAPGPTIQPSWRYLPHCLAAALLLRLGLHMFSDFISYPDELHNYLEQGHRLAFGYGIITWDWHWGARSYLLPAIIAALLLPFKWLGIDHPAYYVPFVEAFFCVVSLLIPWGLYHFTRHQYGETAGRIALLLGVVNFYLLAFAAKTLTETVTGAVLAAALGMAGRPFIRGDAGAWLFGIMLGAIACLRYLYLPVAGILWLIVALAMPTRWTLRSIEGGGCWRFSPTACLTTSPGAGRSTPSICTCCGTSPHLKISIGERMCLCTRSGCCSSRPAASC